MAKTLASLLVLLAAAAAAQTVPADFDGRAPGAFDPVAAFAAAARKPRPAPAAAPGAASASVGDAVFFHGVSLPARAFSRTARVPESLVAVIDATRSTLRLALYELNLPGAADAIVRAKGRGVDVKLVYDYGHGQGVGSGSGAVAAAQSGSQPGTASGPSAQFAQVVAAGVETRLLKGGGLYGIMHDKVLVADGELVETGSFNWTNAADQSNFENALFRDDPSLAALYSAAFDWMWAYGTPVGAPAASGPSSFAPPPSDPSPSLRYKGQPWPRASFSPGGGTEARLVSAIAATTGRLDIAIFSFYSQAVADAVVAAKGRGVAVRVAADVSQARRSPQVAQLVAAGVDLRLSGGRAAGGRGVLHHKFALLDGQMLATGSYNFSANAENNNFENQFYSTDAGDLTAYQAEFEAVWAQAHAPAPGEVAGPAVAVAGR